MEKAILIHQRSRRRILITNVISVLAMFPFLYVMAAAFEFRGPPMWICIGLLVFNLIMYAHSTYKVWMQPNDFRCSLHVDRICCECPDATMGSTFDLPFTELREIREEPRMEGGPKYVLVSTDGVEYWLTEYFGNPAWRFVREIRKLCPKLIVDPNI